MSLLKLKIKGGRQEGGKEEGRRKEGGKERKKRRLRRFFRGRQFSG